MTRWIVFLADTGVNRSVLLIVCLLCPLNMPASSRKGDLCLLGVIVCYNRFYFDSMI